VEPVTGHGGELALAALTPFGVRELFTLSGGHVFPLYDAAVKQDVRIVDVRHEQTATFAAEAMAKLTRRPGVAVLTAGPGVTNGISAITTAHFNGSPLVVLGGRAPQNRWGSGSLQEFDHVPVLAPITKDARTITDVNRMAAEVGELATLAMTRHKGPVFADLPLDVVFAEGEGEIEPGAWTAEAMDLTDVERAAALIGSAERPALVAGTDVYWGGAWEQLQAAVEHLRVPTFVNGLGRGCLPADHELAFSRTRGLLKTEADVVVVVGTPLDFRLSFGRFGDAQVVHVVDSEDQRAGHADTAVSVAGDLRVVLQAWAEGPGPTADHEPWIARIGELEAKAEAEEAAGLEAGASPILPTRIYGEVRRRLDRDAIVVNDGGDFVSYSGKYIDSYLPGCWLDTGPYGCLGTGVGYATAARLAHPDRQVVVMMGDGAAGFSLMDVDTLVRHELPVVIVVGNNGIWGLEKHPMQAIYGYDVAADLQPGTRYDLVVEALGGAGETVTEPEDVGPALDRAFASGVPYLVNVLTEPADVYPRSSNLG
jgi:thiamine pyrophosphate-dependent acetolactate synthase large subunit-like protein